MVRDLIRFKQTETYFNIAYLNSHDLSVFPLFTKVVNESLVRRIFQK